ncbi:hypothetical protein ACGF0J_11460 [Nonomuraea sp. NPDC047897]|uniref:hypothetical protein n=1 Tax=Nonomuraea sp. NPDC047897 TaxID=3364346 RepID=UPI0037110EC8
MPNSSRHSSGPHHSSRHTLGSAKNRMERLAAQQARLNQVKVDPDFFRRVLNLAKAHNRPIYAGLATSGLVVAGTTMVVAALGNVSDPRRFFDARSRWNEMLSGLKLSAWDVWISFFSLVTPYWVGHAAETVQRYLRFELIGMFDELGRVATEMSNTLTSLAWDVVDYDVKLVTLLVSAGTAFTALLPFSAVPAVKLTLGVAGIAFLSLLASLMQEFIGKIKALDLKLEALGHKIFELRSLFAVGGDKLHLQPPGSDPGLWKPVTREPRAAH